MGRADVSELGLRRWGRTGPLVVLVHGVVASSRTWWRVGAALAEHGWSVLAVDLPGHGTAPPLRGMPDLGGLADGLVRALDTAGVARPVPVLWGHSLGALVVMEAARRVPGLAERVVLEEPPGRRGVDLVETARGVRAEVAAARADLSGFLERQRQDHREWAEGDVAAREDVALCDAEAVAAALERGLGFDLVGLARQLPVPALLLAAAPQRGSVLAEPERAEVFAALRQGRVVELDGGHCLHRERFDDYLGAATGWLGVPGGHAG